MTAGEYLAMIRAWGLTPIPGGQRKTYSLYMTREKEVTTIPDPEGLTEEERKAVLEALKLRLGVQEN